MTKTIDLGTTDCTGPDGIWSICGNTFTLHYDPEAEAALKDLPRLFPDDSPNPRDRGKGRKCGSVRFKRRRR